MPRQFWSYILCSLVVALWVGATVIPADNRGLAAESAGVNRAAKANRLVTAEQPVTAATTVASVEIVGLRDTAIIYRDRDGRVLYRSDPIANVTLVSKGRLPEVTVRESKHSAIAPRSIIPASADAPPFGTQPAPAKRQQILLGCDPLVSPLADPTRAVVPGKCLAAAEPRTKLALASTGY